MVCKHLTFYELVHWGCLQNVNNIVKTSFLLKKKIQWLGLPIALGET